MRSNRQLLMSIAFKGSSREIDPGQLALRKIDFLQFACIKIGFIQATVLVTDILLLAESQGRHLQVAFPEDHILKDPFSHRGADEPAIHEADPFHRHFIQLHIGEIAAFEDDIPQVQLRTVASLKVTFWNLTSVNSTPRLSPRSMAVSLKRACSM
jgi:hypothetical protein